MMPSKSCEQCATVLNVQVALALNYISTLHTSGFQMPQLESLLLYFSGWAAVLECRHFFVD
jgi:hypothetical protein